MNVEENWEPLCVFWGEGTKTEVLRVNDKQSIARNSIETEKIWKRV